MRRVGWAGLTTALVMGLGAAFAAAGQAEGESKPAARGLLAGLFGDKSKPKDGAEKEAPIEEKPSPANSPEMAAAEQQRQMNAVLRRMEVCDRLRMIALQTGNDDLMRQADELESRAREVYRRQTSRFPVATPSAEPPSRSTDKKPVVREKSRASSARNRDLEELPPSPPRRPASALDRMGGDFDSRERSILNGTSMGRDRP